MPLSVSSAGRCVIADDRRSRGSQHQPEMDGAGWKVSGLRETKPVGALELINAPVSSHGRVST